QIGNAANAESAKGMSHEDHIRKLLGLDQINDILREDVEGDILRKEMPALAEARLGRRVDGVAERPQAARNAHPAPAPMPGAVYKNKGRARPLRRLGPASPAGARRQSRDSSPSQDFAPLHRNPHP